MFPFRFQRAMSVEEAVDALRADPEAQLLAGGQTLLPLLKHRLAQPTALVDLSGIADLRVMESDDRAITVGAMVRHAEVAGDAAIREKLPALAFLAAGIGDPSVRNMGTIGGSLALNHPAADYPAAVLGLDATVHTDRRSIAADGFLQGIYETGLAEDEIIVSVSFPRVRRAGYCRFGDPASHYVLAGALVAETDSGVHVAINGAGPCAFRLPEYEAALSNRFRPDVLHGLAVDPEGLNDDEHGSPDYRAHLAAVAIERAVKSALAND